MVRLSIAVTAVLLSTSQAMAQGKGIRLWNLTTANDFKFSTFSAGKDNWGPNQALNDRDKEVDHDERLRITGIEPGRYDARVRLSRPPGNAWYAISRSRPTRYSRSRTKT